MEPKRDFPEPVVKLISQARATLSNPNLSSNIQKLSKDQAETLLSVLNQQEHLAHNYDVGSDPHWEKGLDTITTILAGQTSKKIFQRDIDKKQVDAITHLILEPQKHLNKSQIFHEGTTESLVNSLKGAALVRDDQLLYQLYRDIHNLKDHVFINKINIPIEKPKNAPAKWQDLIPDELQKWLNDDPQVIHKVALMFTQGIAENPLSRGRDIKDPLYPNAEFQIKGYPFFQFSKSIHGEISLEIRSRGELCLPDMEHGGFIPLKHYAITQLVNLYNPFADVLLVIKPENNQH